MTVSVCIYDKHNTTWKALCTVFTHEMFLYQKSPSFATLTRSISDTLINNSCVNTARLHFPWSILYVLYFVFFK